MVLVFKHRAQKGEFTIHMKSRKKQNTVIITSMGGRTESSFSYKERVAHADSQKSFPSAFASYDLT